MSEALDSGAIAEGSEQWYEFQQNLNGVKEKIQECETEYVKFANSIRETEWGHFDYLQDRISQINEEASFLTRLMSNKKLYEDNGQFTERGMASAGLAGVQYNVYMNQADKYGAELKKVNADLANDPNNTKLIARYEELNKKQREAILNAEDQKNAMKDLVKNGIDAELKSLNKLITEYNKAMESQKSLLDYQKKVDEQSRTVSGLQKQLTSISGDTSEEQLANRQKLQEQLKDAQNDLQETEMDRAIDETKQILSDLSDDYEEFLNNRLDDIDSLITDLIDEINANASSISDTLNTEATNVGTTLSTSMDTIWNQTSDKFDMLDIALGEDGALHKVITKYGTMFDTAQTNTKAAIDAIAVKVGQMVDASKAKAQATVKTTQKTTPKSTPTKTVTPPKQQSQPKKSTTPTRSEKDNYGVALAIINGNYGWGNDPFRSGALTKKGFNASYVQQLVNKIWSEGYINSGAWLGRYQGIRDLSPFAYNKYAKGGLVNYTGRAWVDGTPSNPEAFLSAEDTKRFTQLKNVLENISKGNSPFSTLFNTNGVNIASGLNGATSVPNSAGTNIGDINQSINIVVNNPQNYDEFVRKLRDDNQFAKMIQSITIDRIAGGNSLAKNKFFR